MVHCLRCTYVAMLPAPLLQLQLFSSKAALQWAQLVISSFCARHSTTHAKVPDKPLQQAAAAGFLYLPFTGCCGLLRL